MTLPKIIARRAVFPVLYRSGLTTMMHRLARKKLLNVMYHGVVQHPASHFSARHIVASQFERHLQYYKKHFDIVSLTEAFRMYRNNISPRRRTITISFDDGYLNNLTVALPLLEKYKIPSTIFVTGFSVERREIPIIWADVIACYYMFNRDVPLVINDVEFVHLRRRTDGLHLFDFLKQCPANERDQYISQIFHEFDLEEKFKTLPTEFWQLMNPSELRQLNESPLIDIGAHGHMHYNLANIQSDIARSDMADCKKALSRLLGDDIGMIAFPDGNYNEHIKDIAEELGYRMQLAVDYLSPNDKSDKRILNRHILSATTTFASNMCYLSYAFHTRSF